MRPFLTIILTVFILIDSSALSFAQPKGFAANSNLLDPITIEEKFLMEKAKKAFVANGTVREYYNSISFLAYPRVDINDIVEAGRQPDAFFNKALLDTYAYLNKRSASSSEDIRAAAVDAIKLIIANPKKEISVKVELPTVGDVWFQSFYLASMYFQLNNYEKKIVEDNKKYKEKLIIENGKYDSKHDKFPNTYKNYNFILVESKIDPIVFVRQQERIEEFIAVYAINSHRFVKFLLQAEAPNSIPGADVRKFNERNREDILPFVNWSDFEKTILTGMPSPNEFYEQANKAVPLGKEKLKECAGAAAITPCTMFSSLAWLPFVFDLVSYPGYMVKNNIKYDLDNGVDRKEIVRIVAEELAAAEYNKKLALIANSLFEFEKPFYYSFYGIPGADKIGKYWHAIATDPSYSSRSLISKIASDNLVNSGQREYQNRRLADSIQKREIQINGKQVSEFLLTSIQFGVDAVLAEGIFILAAPIMRISRGIGSEAKKIFFNELKKPYEMNGTRPSEIFVELNKRKSTVLDLPEDVVAAKVVKDKPVSSKNISKNTSVGVDNIPTRLVKEWPDTPTEEVKRFMGTLRDVLGKNERMSEQELFELFFSRGQKFENWWVGVDPSVKILIENSSKYPAVRRAFFARLEELAAFKKASDITGHAKIEYLGDISVAVKSKQMKLVFERKVKTADDLNALFKVSDSRNGKVFFDSNEITISENLVEAMLSTETVGKTGKEFSKFFRMLLDCSSKNVCKYRSKELGGVLYNVEKGTFIRISKHEMGKSPHIHVYEPTENPSVFISHTISVKFSGLKRLKMDEMIAILNDAMWRSAVPGAGVPFI